MVWSNKHNEVLVQEMYLFEPWNFKRGSKQRGQVWERISESLNQYESPKFTVNQKSVRDHYIFLEKEQASGIAPVHTPFDDSMADIIERFREKDAEDQQQDVEKRGKADEETAKAVEMRKSSVETFAQSKKRKGEQEQKKSKRFTGTETVAYLREKAELHASLKREELQLRRAELDEKKVQQEGLMTQQENLTKMLCESIKSQQKQQEQLLQQMQLQNTALLTLLQGAVSKQKDT